MSRKTTLTKFIKEYSALQTETLDKVSRDTQVILTDEAYEAAEDELEELIESEEWSEEEMMTMIGLIFGIAYANRVREQNDD